ncbi:MAG: hypothetical protein HQL51_11575 [Magnetococcales bacterium]|nr:hypothetical protein [Magnetococcales bacterium]
MSRHDACPIYALFLNRQGGGRESGWQEIRAWRPGETILLLVSRPDGGETQRWLKRESGLDPEVVESLLRTCNRPQCVSYKGGVLLTLRAAAYGTLHDPTVMPCVNLWIDHHRVIAIRSEPVHVFEQIRGEIAKGEGPEETGELISDVLNRLMQRLEPLLLTIGGEVDGLEDRLLMNPEADIQQDLVTMRRKMITLRNILSPEHEAISNLLMERYSWLNESVRRRLSEINTRLHHYLAELDATRERAMLLQDEIMNSQTHKMNRTMKILTVITAFLMPVNSITSLLGTNIEGIPGQAGSGPPWGFSAEVGGLALVMLLSYIIFKRLKLFE